LIADVKKFDRADAIRAHVPAAYGMERRRTAMPGMLFKDIGATGRFYFLHSYYFAPKDANMILGVTGLRWSLCIVRAFRKYLRAVSPGKKPSMGHPAAEEFC